MYAKPDEVEEYLKQNTGKPYISCEYMHAMGNSLGGMKLYTDLEDKYEAYQAALWVVVGGMRPGITSSTTTTDESSTVKGIKAANSLRSRR